MPDLDRTTLLKLRELDAKATKGPWLVFHGEHGRMRRYVDIKTSPDLSDIELPDCVVVEMPDIWDSDDNAELIAAMRNALPALLTALEHLIDPAPSEAPAEAFAAEQLDLLAKRAHWLSQDCDGSGDYADDLARMSEALHNYAHLVRERHTGKG